jgi:hypothetical protein
LKMERQPATKNDFVLKGEFNIQTEKPSDFVRSFLWFSQSINNDLISSNGNSYVIIAPDDDLSSITIPFAFALGDFYNTADEIIAVNNNSIILQQIYQSFKSNLDESNQIADIHETLANRKETDIDALIHDTQDEYEKYRRNFFQKVKVPIVPLEKFIAIKSGVCRHCTMLAVYLIQRLIADKLLPVGGLRIQFDADFDGEIAKDGRVSHMWAVYQPKESTLGYWLIDAQQ